MVAGQGIVHIHERPAEAACQRPARLPQEVIDTVETEAMQTGQAIGRQPQDIEWQGRDSRRILPWGHNRLVTAGPCQSGSRLGDPGEDSASGDATLGQAVADAGQHSMALRSLRPLNEAYAEAIGGCSLLEIQV